MSSQHEILDRLTAYLGEHLENTPPEPITAESSLVKDLNLDSIQSFEMVADLEDHYDISIPLDEMESLQTVGDLARAISALLGPKG